MTHYLAELYSPTPAWLALDASSRHQFFEAIGPGMAGLSSLGVEALAFGETDASILNAPGQRFFAFWRCPNRAALDALVEGIAATGWHDYFKTANAAGVDTDLSEHMIQLANI